MIAGAVLVATVHREEVSGSFAQSMIAMLSYDAVGSQRLLQGGGPFLLPATPMTLPAIRNTIARRFLDESDAEWLLLVDSDMGFAPDTADALVEAAMAGKALVVGALCFGMRKREPDDMGGYRSLPYPTLYVYERDEATGKSGFRNRYDYPDNTLLQVSATGAAMLLVHRDALAKTDEPDSAGRGTWFDRVKLEDGGELLGEDMSFCARLAAHGIGVFVHTGIKTTHLRTFWLDEQFYLDIRELHAHRAAAEQERSHADATEE